MPGFDRLPGTSTHQKWMHPVILLLDLLAIHKNACVIVAKGHLIGRIVPDSDINTGLLSCILNLFDRHIEALLILIQVRCDFFQSRDHNVDIVALCNNSITDLRSSHFSTKHILTGENSIDPSVDHYIVTLMQV